MTNNKRLKIGLIAFEGVEELDLVGPWEIFQAADQLSPNFDCQILSLDGQDITAAKGLTLGVHGSFRDHKELDLLLLPGGRGARVLIQDAIFMASFKQLANNSTWVTSVCTGALVLAQADLLLNKPCTTHHQFVNTLAKMDKTGKVLTDQRYVESGKVITAAGVSAGIDMALYLVGKFFGVDFAAQVQKYVEYYPLPAININASSSVTISKRRVM